MGMNAAYTAEHQKRRWNATGERGDRIRREMRNGLRWEDGGSRRQANVEMRKGWVCVYIWSKDKCARRRYIASFPLEQQRPARKKGSTAEGKGGEGQGSRDKMTTAVFGFDSPPVGARHGYIMTPDARFGRPS